MLDRLMELAMVAGDTILQVYHQSDIAIQIKADSSPVTVADQQAEAVILAGLRRLYPAIPCVAEEEVSSGLLPGDLPALFFLIDPLDGTKEFISRRDEFTVNIALIEHGVPVVGVVYAPALSMLYAGRPGYACKLNTSVTPPVASPMYTSPVANPVRVVASRSYRTPETDDYIQKLDNAVTVSIGSSLKFCLLASGEADLYPRFGRTMEWDTAAGDAVLRAAGGETVTLSGEPLRYGKRQHADDVDFANPWFIARSEAG